MIVSIFAVASSNINIAGLWAKILANASSCFCPAEYVSPLSLAISSTPSGSAEINSSAEDNFITSFISSSDKVSFNSIFSLILFAKINGSCKIIPIFFLSNRKLISLILIPSNKISPFWIS